MSRYKKVIEKLDITYPVSVLNDCFPQVSIAIGVPK